jgi:hypothetical protein
MMIYDLPTIKSHINKIIDRGQAWTFHDISKDGALLIKELKNDFLIHTIVDSNNKTIGYYIKPRYNVNNCFVFDNCDL